MKSQRITFLSSADFKHSLERQARAQKISVGELIRRRFEAPVSRTDEEALLAVLAGELRRSVREARAALADALKEANDTLAALSAGRRKRSEPARRAQRQVA